MKSKISCADLTSLGLIVPQQAPLLSPDMCPPVGRAPPPTWLVLLGGPTALHPSSP